MLSLCTSKAQLTVTLLEHHPTEESARHVVAWYLLAWEVRHALVAGGGHHEFVFKFERSEIVDRDPPPPGERTVSARVSQLPVEVLISAKGTVERGALPAPPTDFVLDPDAEALSLRWRRYADGGESLQSAAYFILTVLERYGGRASGAARLGVSRRVLETLGRLASHTGDVLTARKADAAEQPLTQEERVWMEATIRMLIQRAAEVAAEPDGPREQITMANMPPLPA
jgi:hypothetical protein